MTILEFVKKINQSSPIFGNKGLKELEEKFDHKDAMLNNHLELNSQIKNFEKKIDQLIYGTNIGIVGVGGINFRQKIKFISHDFKEFASYNDFYRLCYSESKSHIISITDDWDEEMIISSTIDQFLLLLYEHHKAYLKEVFNVNYDEIESYSLLSELIVNGVSKQWIKELIPQYYSSNH